MKVFLLFAMIFCHIVDDFYMQGVLAKMKQKQWWYENAPDNLYKNDYKVALSIHALSWSFMIMLPLVIYVFFTHGSNTTFWYVGYPLYFIWNAVVHARVDDYKANKHEINLVIDQSIHGVQILTTYLICLLIYG